jgi:hypothetical protein
MRLTLYEDTIYNNPFPQPWDTDLDYLAEGQAHLAHRRPFYQAIEDFEFLADGTPLPPDLVGPAGAGPARAPGYRVQPLPA